MKLNSREKRNLEKAYCGVDLIHWVNHWAWTYDPRERTPLIPFDLFPKQEEFLHWLQEREENEEEGLAEKCRDVGFTWLCCAYATHAWLFRDNVSIGFGSRKLELVDKIGDPDCIFEKIRIILRNLPPWMLPKGYKESEHDNFCKFVNPETGATITGEGGDNIGRGGRKTVYFIDEAAFLERPQKVEAALSQTSRCKIWVSTPNGPGNHFYRKRFSGRFPVFTFGWQDDPRKGPVWYAEQARTLDAVTLAQEVDIDYTASIAGIVIPAKWVQAATKLEGLLIEKRIAIPSGGKIIAGFDVADEGKNKCVFIPTRGIKLLGVESWGHMNTTQSAYKSKEYGEQYGIDMLNYDCVGVGAGIKGTYSSLDSPPTFQVNPVNTGDSPSDTKWPDGKTSKERFRNLRAELWWLARVKFEKTFEYVELGESHPVDELICLPNHPELIAQLSQPTYHYTETGKIQIESKEAMRKRGIESPDYGDGFVLAVAGEWLFGRQHEWNWF